LKETQAINKSLSALGDVMAAIVRRDPHVPYRNSKLTYLLQPCLGNQAKTLMILNLAPDTASAPETLCSARFGEKVRGRERSRPLLSWLLPLLNSGQVGRAVYIYSLTHYARPPTRERAPFASFTEPQLRALRSLSPSAPHLHVSAHPPSKQLCFFAPLGDDVAGGYGPAIGLSTLTAGVSVRR
jgi:hypothetical protein